MKYLITLLLTFTGILTILITGTSCQSDIYGSGPASQRGSVAGGLAGAAVGAIIGHQSGRGLEGAALGGLIGAATGSTLGDARDQETGYTPTPTYHYQNRSQYKVYHYEYYQPTHHHRPHRKHFPSPNYYSFRHHH